MTIGGTAAYDGESDLPPLVVRAVELARKLDFEYSCLPGQGRLLQVLAAARIGGRIAETGAGCGVGLAWIISGVDPTTSITSVEIDDDRARAVRNLFTDYPHVTLLSGSWRNIIERGPFDLLVLDGGGTGKRAEIDPERADPTTLLRPGATVVIDDFTPDTSWPRRTGHEIDAARMAWLEDPALAAAEVLVAPHMTTIVAALC